MELNIPTKQEDESITDFADRVAKLTTKQIREELIRLRNNGEVVRVPRNGEARVIHPKDLSNFLQALRELVSDCG